MNVTANDKAIESVLTSGFYRVPRFQRPYSWDRSNVEDFWDDVIESRSDYFIGSMVVFADDSMAGLIDGQQRLTTITMMLAAIRNEFLRIGDDEAASGIQTLIQRQDSRGRTRFVLETETSYPYLQANIQAEPGWAQPVAAVRAEERALDEAFAFITERTTGIASAIDANQAIAKSQRTAELKNELGKLRDKLYGLTAVLVEVDNEEDATTIFQTLNSRGKDLETADLVKAHLLQMLRANAGLDQARDTWDSMRESFDESATTISMNRFLLHSWLSREEYVGEKDLFKRVKRLIRSNNAQQYLDALALDAELYRTAQEPSYRTWRKPQRTIAESLWALSLFRLQQPLPFVLSLLRDYDAGSIKLATLLRGLQGVERYHFIATAVTNQPSSGGVSRMYASAARALLSASTAAKKAQAIDELIDKLRQRMPTYAEFEATFVELKSSRQHTQQTTLVRYVLERLHVTAHAASQTAPIDLDLLTVEHLVPQGKRRPKSVSPDDAARVGNLILVTEDLNQELEDKTFAEKQRIFANVPGMEPEILQARAWTVSDIEARSKRLAKRAYDQVWSF